MPVLLEGGRAAISQLRSKRVSEALLTLLKWCLLALVYLFFFRVLQVTWLGSTTNVAVRRVASRRSERRSNRETDADVPRVTALALSVLEPATLAGQRFEVLGEMTIGRAAGCQITLDDTFLSQLHARVQRVDAGLLIEDLGSTNGTYLNRSRVTAPVMAGHGDRLQLGGIVFTVTESMSSHGGRS